MLASVFQSEDVVDEVKRPDLATAVRKQLVTSHCTKPLEVCYRAGLPSLPATAAKVFSPNEAFLAIV
jgi:hypothetical protein